MANEDPPVVLITGAAKRIGAAIARRFARSGWRVVIHYLSSETEAKAREAELRALGAADTALVRANLAEVDEARAAFDEASRLWGRIDCLVNNASQFAYDTPGAVEPELWGDLSRTNFLTPSVLMQRLVETGRGRRTAINLLDQKLANPNPDFFSYTATKVALHAAVTMFAQWHRDSGVRFYGLAPGLSQPSGDQTEEEFMRSRAINALQRPIDLDDIAEGAFFLARGDLANGETLYVDCGQRLIPADRDVMFQIRE